MSEKVLTFTGHLEELRRRLLIAVVAILVATAAAMFFSNQLLTLILLPAGGMHLKAFELLDGFVIRFRVALYAGVVVAFPVWAYQLYSFIRPGLLERERRVIFPLIFGSMFLFVLGMAFGYTLLWKMIGVLMQFFPPNVDLLPSADSYISFVVFFLLSCGLAFQLPTILIILVELHILNARILQKQRRIAYFVLFAFAEIVTPVADPIIAPLIVMVPLVVLYEVSIFFARRIDARERKIAADSQSVS